MSSDDPGHAAAVESDDVAAAAAAWADPETSAKLLARCPDEVVEYLSTVSSGLCLQVLANPSVPDTVKAAVAAQSRGYVRRAIVHDLLRRPAAVGEWLLLSAAFTAATLEQAVRALKLSPLAPDEGTAARDQALAREILRGFTLSRDPRRRTLAAQAFPLTTAARHGWREGKLSAPRLAADPDRRVRTGLARNYMLRDLPDDQAGLSVRQALLTDPDPGVRAAAARNRVSVTDTELSGWMRLVWGEAPPPVVPALVVPDPLDDPAPRVRATAIPALTALDLARWERVAADPSAVVRAAAATNGWAAPPQVWEALARDSDPKVRTAVVRSRFAPATLLRRMTGDPDELIATAAQARVVE